MNKRIEIIGACIRALLTAPILIARIIILPMISILVVCICPMRLVELWWECDEEI